VSELSPKAASLVRAGRTALRPTAADRDRIAGALRARLGDAALPLETGAATSLVAESAWAKIAGIGATIGIAGGVAFVALHGSEPTPNRGPLHQLDLATAAQVEPSVRPPAAPSEPTPLGARTTSAATESGTAPSARRAGDKLAQEVAILSRATTELRAGRAGNALKALEEHQRKFPNGLLTEERRAARVQALCALGRRSEAQPELERLTRTAPQSPNTVRAKQICNAEKAR
jgi:hypothetical protein